MICAREGCENVITEKRRFNQKYCCYECCKIATNARIMQKYWDRKARLAGEDRYCKTCKTKKLSKYNEEDICFNCSERRQENQQKLIQDLFADIDLVP